MGILQMPVEKHHGGHEGELSAQSPRDHQD